MLGCKEFALDDLLEIKTIPIDRYESEDATAIKPTIPQSKFSPSYDEETITIGYSTTKGSLIPIIRQTGKAKDSTSDNVAGRLHTVTVKCEIDQRDDEVWDLLLRLEREPRHLILTSRDGSLFFCQATIDTYTCDVDRDEEKVSVSFKVHCLMGLQKIIP